MKIRKINNFFVDKLKLRLFPVVFTRYDIHEVCK